MSAVRISEKELAEIQAGLDRIEKGLDRIEKDLVEILQLLGQGGDGA